MKRLGRWFDNLNYLQALLLGLGLGALSILPAALSGRPSLAVIGVLAYFPFHAWLCISLFLVVFSLAERERMVGAQFGLVGAVWARMLSRYGIFCMTWFFSICLLFERY